MKKKVEEVAVLGLGRFGSSVAKTLFEMGVEVLAVDEVEENLDKMGKYITEGLVADCTDEKVLERIGIKNFDVVVVSIGTDLEASILTCLSLKNLGIKTVISKALDEKHGQVLEKIGVDLVIYPEMEMGEKVAKQIVSPNVLNFIELSGEYSIEEVYVQEKMVGKTMVELDLRKKYKVNVIAIKNKEEVNVTPEPTTTIKRGDVLVAVGKQKDLKKLSR